MTANFLFVSDNNYASSLGISSYSVLHNMSPAADKVRIFVMDCGITEENKERLRKQTARFENAEIIFYNIEKQLDEIVPKVKARWHRAIYGRLLLDEIVARYDELERLVYMDCDTLMNKPVTELFEMDLQGMCVGGVQDSDHVSRKRVLHIDQEHTYINSGVLVIDTAKWIELNASQRIIAYINSFTEELKYPDQDAINYILSDYILRLQPEYNMMWMICDKDIPIMLNDIEGDLYTPEELHYALYNAKIYHYASHNMWEYEDITPIPDHVIEKYRKLCDWRDQKRHFRSFSSGFLWIFVTIKRVLVGEYWKKPAE